MPERRSLDALTVTEAEMLTALGILEEAIVAATWAGGVRRAAHPACGRTYSLTAILLVIPLPPARLRRSGAVRCRAPRRMAHVPE